MSKWEGSMYRSDGGNNHRMVGNISVANNNIRNRNNTRIVSSFPNGRIVTNPPPIVPPHLINESGLGGTVQEIILNQAQRFFLSLIHI